MTEIIQSLSIESYLSSLPRRDIFLLPVGTPAPNIRAVGTLADYNGFTGKERLRTFEIAKWLDHEGAMPHSEVCSICGGSADQQHAEDYYDLASWMDICRGCHVSLHGRLRTPCEHLTHGDVGLTVSMCLPSTGREICPTPRSMLQPSIDRAARVSPNRPTTLLSQVDG